MPENPSSCNPPALKPNLACWHPIPLSGYPHLPNCREVEDVRSALILVRRGAAQVYHVFRVEEFREQLEVEEEDGDRQEEEE